MNSSISRTCVHEASLLSRTPYCAERHSPLAQIPGNPASSAMRADSPLCASSRNSSCGEASSSWKRAVLRTEVEEFYRSARARARRAVPARLLRRLGERAAEHRVVAREVLRPAQRDADVRFLRQAPVLGTSERV